MKLFDGIPLITTRLKTMLPIEISSPDTRLGRGEGVGRIDGTMPVSGTNLDTLRNRGRGSQLRLKLLLSIAALARRVTAKPCLT